MATKFSTATGEIIEQVLSEMCAEAVEKIRTRLLQFDGTCEGGDANEADKVSVVTLTPSSNDSPDIFLKIEQNCRVKAKASRWAAERHRQLEAGADYELEIKPFDEDIIHAGKESGCYLWMSSPKYQPPGDMSFDHLSGCFDALAESISVVRSLINASCKPRPLYERALNLLAEAQAAVRKLASDFGCTDSDQSEVFWWLRGEAEKSGLYFDRYLRADDSPNVEASDLLKRITQLSSEIRAFQHQQRMQKKQLAKVRYASNKVADGDTENGHWNTISRTVAELRKGGLPASNVELRELLTPILALRPSDDQLSPEFVSVVREIDRFQASRSIVDAPPSTRTLPSDVSRVAKLLRNQKVVLIGGDARPDAKRAIEQAFELDELIWILTDSHASYREFEPIVARTDVALVLLAIRWASHSFGKIGGVCERLGKPLVRLPNGLNPNQIAAQIMQQASRQLRAIRRAKEGS